MAKRYLLLLAERPLGQEDLEAISGELKARALRASVIQVDANPMAVIVKTDQRGAMALRERAPSAGPPLRAVLSSGSIGKLKSRAKAAVATVDGQVPK
ncbi:MAG: hypothetical protein HY247_03800 [archaeon]|nr:MAG: hypothetical protein HY247_03800 [archaeon]